MKIKIISQYLRKKHKIDKNFKFEKRIKAALNQNKDYVFVDVMFYLDTWH
ncbi:MAG: hypothetical protein RBQ91_04000 [Acholeplasma sp.]|nr:hypothetical protein [Acholeplasma sp.]